MCIEWVLFSLTLELDIHIIISANEKGKDYLIHWVCLMKGVS